MRVPVAMMMILVWSPGAAAQDPRGAGSLTSMPF
jgi:hypothetical protein